MAPASMPPFTNASNSYGMSVQGAISPINITVVLASGDKPGGSSDAGSVLQHLLQVVGVLVFSDLSDEDAVLRITIQLVRVGLLCLVGFSLKRHVGTLASWQAIKRRCMRWWKSQRKCKLRSYTTNSAILPKEC